jgi:hypothetical protein
VTLSTFPGAVDVLPDPTATTSPAGDLDHPAHHQLHAEENDAIVATEETVLANAATVAALAATVAGLSTTVYTVVNGIAIFS